MSEILIGEMYEYKKELLTVKSKAKITEFRDGEPFDFPAVILEDSQGQIRAMPEYQLERLAKYHPTHKIVGDEYEVFMNAYKLATEGRFTKELNSFHSEQYASYAKSVNALIDNYDKSFASGGLSDKSKELLKSFAMMLFVTIEVSAVRLKEKKGVE